MTQQVQTPWCWNRRPVRLVDGTTVELPETEENCRVYPQSQPGKGCPLARIVGIICLASGGVLNAAIGPFGGKGSGEQTLLRSMLDTFAAGDIVLGDAYYGTYFLIAELIDRGVDDYCRESISARAFLTAASFRMYFGICDSLNSVSIIGRTAVLKEVFQQQKISRGMQAIDYLDVLAFDLVGGALLQPTRAIIAIYALKTVVLAPFVLGPGYNFAHLCDAQRVPGRPSSSRDRVNT